MASIPTPQVGLTISQPGEPAQPDACGAPGWAGDQAPIEPRPQPVGSAEFRDDAPAAPGTTSGGATSGKSGSPIDAHQPLPASGGPAGDSHPDPGPADPSLDNPSTLHGQPDRLIWIPTQRRGINWHEIGGIDVDNAIRAACGRSIVQGLTLPLIDPWIAQHAAPCPRCSQATGGTGE